MKNNIKYSLLTFAVLFLLAGCNNFLDKAPDERTTINTLEKASQLINGAYDNTRGYRFLSMCDDNTTLVAEVYDNDDIITDLYTWNRDFRKQNHQDSPSEYWRVAYKSISAVNHALEALDGLEIKPEDKAKEEVIRGEGLVIRSYYHFMLVNIFAKHYDPTTASTDLGVPYVTETETELIKHYERNTVEQVYNLAEKDLLDGIKLLEKNSNIFKPNKYHFTFPTIYMYASRLYTFRNKDNADLDAAIEFAEKSLDEFGGLDVLIHWNTYETNEYAAVDVDNPAVGMVQGSASWIAYPYPWMYGMTNATKVELGRNPYGLTDYRHRITYIFPGDSFHPAFFYYRGTNGVSYTDLFPIAEAVLLAAEGYARKGEVDDALFYLMVQGSTVYGGFDQSLFTIAKLKDKYGQDLTDQEALIQQVLFERRNQFLLQGKRWFDIKRYNIDVEHKLSDGSILKLSEVAPNKDFQIPSFAIEAGVTPNK